MIKYNHGLEKDTQVIGERFVRYSSHQHKPPFLISFEEMLSDKLQLVSTIRAGLPNSFYLDLLDHLPLTEARWASILDVSIKSLRRYTEGDHTFKSIHSEKLIEMTEVTLQGIETFGSSDKFHLWLHTPSRVFRNIAPVELLADSYGKDLVLAELVRIDHGIFA